MQRVEIQCAKCDNHLGHVFFGENGVPSPKKDPKDRERHCVNSKSVKYDKINPKQTEEFGTIFDGAIIGVCRKQGLAESIPGVPMNSN